MYVSPLVLCIQYVCMCVRRLKKVFLPCEMYVCRVWCVERGVVCEEGCGVWREV